MSTEKLPNIQLNRTLHLGKPETPAPTGTGQDRRDVSNRERRGGLVITTNTKRPSKRQTLQSWKESQSSMLTWIWNMNIHVSFVCTCHHQTMDSITSFNKMQRNDPYVFGCVVHNHETPIEHNNLVDPLYIWMLGIECFFVFWFSRCAFVLNYFSNFETLGSWNSQTSTPKDRY